MKQIREYTYIVWFSWSDYPILESISVPATTANKAITKATKLVANPSLTYYGCMTETQHCKLLDKFEYEYLPGSIIIDNSKYPPEKY